MTLSPPPSWPARRWWTLGVLCLVQLMVALDATVISIALPWAQRDLAFSTGDRQWLITSYVLAFGSLLLLGGRLCDLWGRRPVLLLGLVGFAGASVLGGHAHAFRALVTARALQGVFAALMAPAALAVVTTTFEDPRERARSFALFGAVGGSGAAVGLILGGALTQWATWRWCLYVNVVLAARGRARGGHARGRVARRAPGAPGRPGHRAGQRRPLLRRLRLRARGQRELGRRVDLGEPRAGGRRARAVRRARGPSGPPVAADAPAPAAHPRGIAGRALRHSLGVFSLSLFLAYYLQNTLDYSPLRTGVYFLPLVVALGVSTTMASARLLARTGRAPSCPSA